MAMMLKQRRHIRQIAAAMTAAADRSHLEPPLMAPTKRITRFVKSKHQVLSASLPSVEPFCRVRVFDLQNPVDVYQLKSEIAWRKQNGCFFPNPAEVRAGLC